MKRFKIVPAYSAHMGMCYRVYQRVLLFLWEYVSTEFTLKDAEKIIEHLGKKEIYK